MVLPQVSKPEDLQEVGSKIRFLRKEKKMSQLELAEAIGVTQNTIYLIETGQGRERGMGHQPEAGRDCSIHF